MLMVCFDYLGFGPVEEGVSGGPQSCVLAPILRRK